MKDFPTKLFINGEFRRSKRGESLLQIDPATETTFAEVDAASVAEIHHAVEAAHEAYLREWRDIIPQKRAEVLFNISRLIRQNKAALAELESRNIGKPISDARDEIELGARIFEYYAGAVSQLFGQTIPVGRGGFDFTLRQSLGVVAAIVPWNFPFPIACWKTAPALAAGNTVVLKPASQSPLTALLLGKIAHEAELPCGVLQVVPGKGSEIGNVLLSHALVRKISFTGSTNIGSRIMALAAGQLKRVSLELGGKSPNIVFADSDVERAAATSPMAVFGNAGQDCCARSRILVERRVFDRFVELFIEATRKLIVGDPTEEKTEIGPLVSASQRQISEDFIEESRKAGHVIACGGQRPRSKGFYLSPTVLLGVKPENRVWREEVFGPVACIRPFDDETQMLQEVNDSRYGLSGSIWTSDLKRAMRVSRLVESGVLSINSHSSVHIEAPFGGFKQSGIGRDLGMAALDGYTEVKNVYVAD